MLDPNDFSTYCFASYLRSTLKPEEKIQVHESGALMVVPKNWFELLSLRIKSLMEAKG